MFEKEVESILLKQKNSLELIEQIESIYKPYEYGQPKYNDAFSIDFKICSPYQVKVRAKEEMKNILQYREIRIKADNNATIEELAEIVKNTTIDDFYFNMVEYFPYNNNKEWELSKMQYTEKRVHWRKLQLILNCIWLLNHEEPTTREINNKIDKMSENGETFIFCGCKVTNYKNGNLKIQFSDAKIFEEFHTRFDAAYDKAVKEYEREKK